MTKQDFKHHRRFYSPHHFVLYPVLFALLVAVCTQIVNNAENRSTWMLFAALIVISTWISYMMRQHYALTLQNRIVRLEMRLRYYQLTGIRFETYEHQLSFSQLAALRFSSDEELPSLLEKAIAENLSPSEIKRQIKNWHPDHMRV